MGIFRSALIVFMTVSAVFTVALGVSADITLSGLQNPSPQAPAPQAQTPPPSGTAVPAPTSPAAPPATLPVERVFAADAGMIFNPIRPDKVNEFEMIIGRIHDALLRSNDETRKKQAAGWKVFKASEPGPSGSVL